MKENFWDWLTCGSPYSADMYWQARRAAVFKGSKHLGVGGAQVSHGEGLLVALQEVLANHHTAETKKAWPVLGCCNSGWVFADLT